MFRFLCNLKVVTNRKIYKQKCLKILKDDGNPPLPPG